MVRVEDQAAADQINAAFICQDDIRSQSTRFALQLNNYDNDFFRDTVQKRRTKLPAPALASHKRIGKAYKYLYTAARKRFESVGSGKAGYEEIVRLYTVLTDYVSVVAVKSRDPDNAAEVFETLNYRGIGLSTPDLLRNYLLMRARQGDRMRIVGLWEKVLGLTGDGVNVEDFLRHHWVSHYGDVKSRALYGEIKGHITKAKLNPANFSSKLADSAAEYATLVKCEAKDKSLQMSLEAVQALNAKVLLPALLSAREVGSESRQRALASALVAVHVRHNLIGGLEGSALETLVFEIAKKLRGNKDFGDAIKKLRAFAPSDRDFEASFAVADVGRSKSARYLLTAIEHKIRRTGEMRVEDSRMTHVEHIYPVAPAKADRWVKHDALVNRLGNQTLLASALNSGIKNGRFSAKLPAYRKSDIRITKALTKKKKWNEQAIDDRQRWLAEYAPRIWTV